MPRFRAALALLTLLSGCGKVAAPQPPFIRIPAPINDLSATQSGYDLLLTWTNPALNIDSSNATDLATVHVSADGNGITRIAPTGAGLPQSMTVPIRSSIGTPRTFAVWLQTAREKVSAAAEVRITPVEVPGVVVDLKAFVDQYVLNVTWQAPVENPSLADRYIVRRLDRRGGPVITAELQFKDSSFERGQQYTYEVVAARQTGLVLVPGLSGPSFRLTATDTIPPRAPAGLRFTASDSGAIIVWNASEELDLAGYHVFRNGSRLGTALQAVNSFFDPDYRSVHTYTVSAVDEFGNESPRSAPVPH